MSRTEGLLNNKMIFLELDLIGVLVIDSDVTNSFVGRLREFVGSCGFDLGEGIFFLDACEGWPVAWSYAA